MAHDLSLEGPCTVEHACLKCCARPTPSTKTAFLFTTPTRKRKHRPRALAVCRSPHGTSCQEVPMRLRSNWILSSLPMVLVACGSMGSNESTSSDPVVGQASQELGASSTP